MKTPRALVACVLLTLVAGACTQHPAESTGGADLSGPSVKVMTITPMSGTTGVAFPEAVAAVQAAAKGINSRGGINGRRVEVIACDSKSDPQVTASCGREAVAQGVVATVGDVAAGTTYYPILRSAGIPVIGALPNDPEDFTSPLSFPVVGGTPTLGAGAGALVAEQGARTAEAVCVGVQAGELVAPLINAGLATRGAAPSGKTSVPISAPDMSSYVANAAASHPDALVVALLRNDAARFVQQVRGSKAATRIAVLDFDDTVVQQLGAAAEGLLVPTLFQPLSVGGPVAERYTNEMNAHDSNQVKDSVNAVNAWVAMQVFAEVAQDLPEIKADTLREAMGRVKNLDIGGLIPPLSTDSEFSTTGLNRLFNHKVYFNVVQDGKLKPLAANPVDPFAPATTG